MESRDGAMGISPREGRATLSGQIKRAFGEAARI